MIRRPLLISALLALPAACSGGGEADRAVTAENGAAAANMAAPADNAAGAASAAPDANASAGAADGACPYRTRNFRAAVRPAQPPNTGHELELNWDAMPDAQRRYPGINVVEQTPLVVVELIAGGEPTPPEFPADWMDSGSMGSYNPANTHAVLRCAGREIARVPIPRPR